MNVSNEKVLWYIFNNSIKCMKAGVEDENGSEAKTLRILIFQESKTLQIQLVTGASVVLCNLHCGKFGRD